jgi:hypothetical protein
VSLYEPGLHEPLEDASSRGLVSLNATRHRARLYAPLLSEKGEGEKRVDGYSGTALAFGLENQLEERKVGIGPAQSNNHSRTVASAVIGSGTAVSEEPLIDQVYSAPGSFDQTEALERIRERWVARPRFDDNEIVERYSFDETARIADGERVLLPPDVNGAEPSVVTMRECVRDGFPERSAVDAGDGHAERTDLHFPLGHAGTEELLNALKHTNEWRPYELIDEDLRPFEDLECDLMTRDVIAERRLPSEKKQSCQRRNTLVAIAAHESKRRVELGILQRQERAVTPVTLDRTPEVLSFRRIEVVKACPAHRECGRIEEPKLRLAAAKLVR